MSEAGFFRFFNAPLEKSFTCVNWDQRGAGKSFDERVPKASMNVEQSIADLDGLVDHVRSRLELLRMLRMLLGVPESSLPEVPRVFRALRWTLEAMWPEVSRLNLLEAVPRLEVPVFFFLGRKDHWVPPEVSVQYYEVLEAPSKELLWFESSGHEPFADEPEKYNAAMVERVLPRANHRA